MTPSETFRTAIHRLGPVVFTVHAVHLTADVGQNQADTEGLFFTDGDALYFDDDTNQSHPLYHRGTWSMWAWDQLLTPRERAILATQSNPFFPGPPWTAELAQLKERHAREAAEFVEARLRRWFEAIKGMGEFETVGDVTRRIMMEIERAREMTL